MMLLTARVGRLERCTLTLLKVAAEACRLVAALDHCTSWPVARTEVMSAELGLSNHICRQLSVLLVLFAFFFGQDARDEALLDTLVAHLKDLVNVVDLGCVLEVYGVDSALATVILYL